MNNHCYTEATGHPANRNCSSGGTKQQRAPANSAPPTHRSQRARSQTAQPLRFADFPNRSHSTIFNIYTVILVYYSTVRYNSVLRRLLPATAAHDALINRRLSWQDKPVNIGTVPIPAVAGPPFSLPLPKRKQQPRFVFVVARYKGLNFSRCFPVWILRGGDSPESEDRRDMD